jgi:hypothetical protein
MALSAPITVGMEVTLAAILSCLRDGVRRRSGHVVIDCEYDCGVFDCGVL